MWSGAQACPAPAEYPSELLESWNNLFLIKCVFQVAASAVKVWRYQYTRFMLNCKLFGLQLGICEYNKQECVHIKALVNKNTQVLSLLRSYPISFSRGHRFRHMMGYLLSLSLQSINNFTIKV